MEKIVLAADLGGTNLRVAAVNARGEILYRTKTKTPRSTDGYAILEALTKSAEECKSSLKFEIATMCVALPATVDVENRTVIRAPNLPELDGFGLAKEFCARLSVPVFVENDANAAAVGENWLGASKGFKNSIMVTLGTGVGGGLIVNGEIIRGIDGTAGEIGHICVEPEGKECGCGSHGCVEQYASATAVVRMASEVLPKSEGSSETRSSKDVYDLAVKGDESAITVFDKQGFYLGTALAGLVNVLNPEVLVIGGGASAGWDMFIGQLQEQIEIRAYRKPAIRAKLVRAILGDDAGLLGAAFLGFENSAN